MPPARKPVPAAAPAPAPAAAPAPAPAAAAPKRASKWANVEKKISSRVAAANELVAKVQAAQLADKEQIASEGLAKLLTLPPLPAIDNIHLEPAEAARYPAIEAKFKKQWTDFLEQRKAQSTSRDAIAELFTIGATDLALLMFGYKRVALWEAKYTNDKVRDIFEIGEVDAQCNGTIGEFVPGVTPCWICGMPIWSASATLPCTHENGHSPECEHILPVGQAAIFLQLYDRINSSSDLFKIEYDWSHKTCNQTKNADVYFLQRTVQGSKGAVIDPATQLPILDPAAFKRLLEKIYNSTRADATCEPRPAHKRPAIRNISQFTLAGAVDQYSFRDTLQDWINFKYTEPRSVEKWKEDRIRVYTQKYQAILDYIGGHNYMTSPELYLLSLAAAPAQIVSRQDAVRKVKKGQVSMRRATLGFLPQPIPPTQAAAPSMAAMMAAPAAVAMAGAPPPPPPPALPPIDLSTMDISEEGEKELAAWEMSDMAAAVPAIQGPPEAEEAVLALVNLQGGPPVAAPLPLAPQPLPDHLLGVLHSFVGGELPGGRRRRRTRRRTQSFLPHRRRRTHHAMRTSSRRKPFSGLEESF